MAAVISELETPRLYLRQWRKEDFAPFAALNADPAVMAYFPKVLERSASDLMARRISGLIQEQGWGLWALERKDSGEFIGFTGLHVPGPDLPFSPCVEIGWRLRHADWGCGFASEAGAEALRYGFEELGLAEIVAFTAVGNSRSRAVMRRLGMRESPETFMHPRIAAGSPLREHYLCRLGAGDWAAARSGAFCSGA